MSGVGKAIKIFTKIYENITTALFAFLCFCVILQIFARYVLKVSIPWTEELARYLLIICGFMGAVISFRTGGHLGAYFLRDMTKGRFRGFVYTLNSFVVIFAIALLFYGALKMRSAVAGLDSSTMAWFMQAWLYEAALVGLFLMFCYGVRDLYYSILVLRGKREITLTAKSCPFPEEL